MNKPRVYLYAGQMYGKMHTTTGSLDTVNEAIHALNRIVEVYRHSTDLEEDIREPMAEATHALKRLGYWEEREG